VTLSKVYGDSRTTWPGPGHPERERDHPQAGRDHPDMPPIVIAFHYRNLDAMGGMIYGYPGAKRGPISDGGI
jgi:hypothetical protein